MLFYNDDTFANAPPLVTDGGFSRAKLERPGGLSGLGYTRISGYTRESRYIAGRVFWQDWVFRRSGLPESGGSI